MSNVSWPSGYTSAAALGNYNILFPNHLEELGHFATPYSGNAAKFAK